MIDPRIQNLIRTLVEYCVVVEPGHKVQIGFYPFSPLADPYLKETTRAVLKAGGMPILDLEHEDFQRIMLMEADLDQLEYLDPRIMLMASEVDRAIVFEAHTNTFNLSSVDPERQSRRSAVLRDFYKVTNQRTADGDLRWTLTIVPTDAYAQNAEMSLSEFEDFFFKSTLADTPNPIECWETIRMKQNHYVEMLAGRQKVSVKGPNVDLALSIEDRPFINCAGGENMPDGEIFTAPVEDSAHGWIKFTFPAVYQGRDVQGVRLEFDRGRVVDAAAEKNEPFLLRMLETDPGARYLGEFAFGMNDAIDRFSRNLLFDEKMGGTIHLALGFGYPESGAKNESAIHWDMICDMRDGSQIFLDDELVYENGRFLT